MTKETKDVGGELIGSIADVEIIKRLQDEPIHALAARYDRKTSRQSFE